MQGQRQIPLRQLVPAELRTKSSLCCAHTAFTDCDILLAAYNYTVFIMSLAVLLFYKRRSDFTPEQFKAHMENEYLPLLKTTMGEHFPQSITLRYVERAGTGAGDRFGATMSSKYRNPAEAPVVLVGSPSDVAWDCQCEMIFRDDLQLQQGYAIINSEAGQVVKDEEESFTDIDQMRVVLMEKKTYSA